MTATSALSVQTSTSQQNISPLSPDQSSPSEDDVLNFWIFVSRVENACKARVLPEWDSLKNLSFKNQLLQLKTRFFSFQQPNHRYLDTIETLDLSGGGFTYLPKELLLLRNLKEIDLAYNNFTEFPKILRQFPHLRILGFSIKHF